MGASSRKTTNPLAGKRKSLPEAKPRTKKPAAAAAVVVAEPGEGESVDPPPLSTKKSSSKRSLAAAIAMANSERGVKGEDK